MMFRRLQDVVRARGKYGRGGPCVDCGQPTDSVSTRCDGCLEASWVVDELEFAAGLLRDNPRHAIGLAHDRNGLVHLVLFRSPHLGWCGARVSQLPTKRVHTPPGLFPAATCPACLQAYEVRTP